MAILTKPNTFSAGATIIASEHNENFDTVYNDYNGNITNANISNSAAIAYAKLSLSNSITNSDINSSAAIADTKLDQITTADKVSGEALTSLNLTPSGAGKLPTENVPSFGALNLTYVKNTDYTAATDLWVTVIPNASSETVTVYSDSGALTEVIAVSSGATGVAYSIIAHVKKGDHWKVVTANDPIIKVRPLS